MLLSLSLPLSTTRQRVVDEFVFVFQVRTLLVVIITTMRYSNDDCAAIIRHHDNAIHAF